MENPKFFFEGKNFCFPVNSKVGKHSLCKAIIETDYPDALEFAGEIHDLIYYGHVPQTDKPTKPVLMLVREPIERFISGASMNHGLNDIEESLAKLGEIPFDLQVDYIKAAEANGQTVTLFKFPEQIAEFEQAAGFVNPMSKLNEGNAPEKKTLTDEQLALVAGFYAEDIALYDSL